MKKIILLVIGFILIPNLVFADGGVFNDIARKIYLPNQKAAISWDGKEEILILSTKISIEDLSNLAWVIPIPSKTKPEIEQGDIEIFYDLADLFAKAPGWGLPGCGKFVGQEVEVIESKKVDIYDITTLKAIDATALVSWLNENGYLVPESTIPILEDYCQQEDFYFIANKINLANKYQDLTITEADRVCAQEVSEYIEALPPRQISGEVILFAFEFLAETDCKEANFEAVKVLAELEQGVATPLKIIFQPETPFYPLKISSINNGRTNIDVYLFSETPVNDNSGPLFVSQMTENTPLFGENYGFSQKYITYLRYSGVLEDLKSDSWFQPTEYDCDLDPSCVNWWETILWVLLAIIFFIFALLFLLVPLSIVVLIVIGLVIVVKKIIAKFKKN